MLLHSTSVNLADITSRTKNSNLDTSISIQPQYVAIHSLDTSANKYVLAQFENNQGLFTVTASGYVGLNTSKIYPNGRIEYPSNISTTGNSLTLVSKGYVTGLTNTMVTGSTNLGGNTNGLFTSISNKKLGLKSLVAGDNITLTPSSTGITISSTGGGGGASNGLYFDGSDFKLGGYLVEPTYIDGNSQDLTIENLTNYTLTTINGGNNISSNDGANNSTTIVNDFASINLQSTDGTDSSSITIQKDNINLDTDAYLSIASPFSQIYYGLNGMILLSIQTGKTITVQGATGFRGLQYVADYTANFASRSLVDKGYVTGITTTKLNSSLFNTFTGTTAPATYASKTYFNAFTGTTAPATYLAKTAFNTYSGTTVPATYIAKTYTGTTYTPKFQVLSSTSALVLNTSSYDGVTITGQTTNITISGASHSGIATPDGFMMLIRLKDNGTSRTITYNSSFRAVGITLPTATVISKTLYLACCWNKQDSKWDVIGEKQQA